MTQLCSDLYLYSTTAWVQQAEKLLFSFRIAIFFVFTTISTFSPPLRNLPTSPYLLSSTHQLSIMSRPTSRPGSPGPGSSPRGSVVNLQQYAADAKISSHRGEEVTAGLMSGEQKAAAPPVNGRKSSQSCSLFSFGRAAKTWRRTRAIPYICL